MILREESQLLQLPAELRNKIYIFALVDYGENRIQLRDLQPHPLLATCHQIRDEASPIFFAENKFVLTVNVPPMAFDPNRSYPRVHRVFIPAWIRETEQTTPLQMRNVKVEIDHAFRWVVVTMGEGRYQSRGRLKIVEAWLHNGRQKLPLGDMRERVQSFVDWTIDQKTDVDEGAAGLNYRDVVLIAGKMLRQWAGTIVPV